jgi:hypothetical protein
MALGAKIDSHCEVIMKKSRFVQALFLTVLVCFVFGTVQARADVYMKNKIHTDAFTVMGQSQPAKDEIMVFWMGEKRARTDTEGGNTSMIFLAEKKILYMIDHAKKQYSEMPLDFDKMFSEAAGEEVGDEEDKAQAKAMAGMMKGLMGNMSAKVTDTGETKKIGSWNCRKYTLVIDMGGMGKTEGEAWATEELKVDYAVAYTMANGMMASMPGFEKILAEMKKIKGVVVYQTTAAKVMGSEVKSTTELLEAGNKDAPAGHYDIPAGYKKVKGFGR